MANDPNGPDANPPETWLSRAVSRFTTRFGPGVFIMWLVRRATGPWWGVRYVLRILWACRASMLSVAIGGALIALTDQARDIVIASAIAKDGIPSKIGLIATMLAWAAVSWYWARVTLNFSFTLPALDADLSTLEGAPASWRKPLAWAIGVVAIAVVVMAAWIGRGTAAAAVFAIVALIVAFWTAQGIHADRPQRWQRWWRQHMPRMLGSIAIFCVAVAFWNAHNVYSDADDSNAGMFAYWAGGFVLLAVAFYVAVARRTQWLRSAAEWLPAWIGQYLLLQPDVTHDRLRDYANPIAVGFLVSSLILSPVLFLWFAYDPVGASGFFGGAVRAILFGLATLVPTLSALVLLSARSRLPLVGATISWMALSGTLAGDNHDVRTLDRVGERQRLDRVFVDWWKANAEPRLTTTVAPGVPAVPPMVVVATAGGASRAAYWTSQVLGEIAIREPNFTDRLFLISGVSGGSLGAVAFRSQVTAHREAGGGSLMRADTPKLSYGLLTRDFLTPAMAVGLYVDLPLHAFPWWRRPDRAAALEKAWETAWRAAMQDPKHATFSWEDGFAATFAGNTKSHPSPAWPILMLNGSSVEKGKRVITSNVRIHTPGVGSDNPAGRLNRYDALDILGKDIRISTAVTMSARFPVIAPTGGMRYVSYDANGQPVGGQMEMRVTDGGLYENFGAATADEMLRYIVERRRDTQPDPDRRDLTERPVWPVVILISSDPSLDPLDKQTGTGRKAVADCAAVGGERTPKPALQPGNTWEECPTDGRKTALSLIDPVLSLYSGRTARGEGAASALFQRVTENRVAIRDRVLQNIKAAAGVGDKETATAQAWERLATNGLVEDFFHFRQCRVPKRKGPTMSWHDSPAAWGAMDVMLGLRPDPETGVLDPCGNAGEFFRLCVRLTVVSGVFSKPPGDKALEEAATDECASRWPKPKDWTCDRPKGADNKVCGFWTRPVVTSQSAPIPRGSDVKPAATPK